MRSPDERESHRRVLRRWLEELDAVIHEHGAAAGASLVDQMTRRAAALRLPVSVRPDARDRPLINTLPPPDVDQYPGELELDTQIEALVRWNAMAMVVRANRRRPGIGGHIASHASAATLLEVGFQHFFRGNDHEAGPDRLYLQGHASPGVYARAFLEGRLSERDLDGFRAEVGAGGLSSYPHPRLMPRFWETPSVSMGLAPLSAIYRARFDRYLVDRGITEVAPRTWAIVGDGEMDEPESTGAISIAAREGLSNLTFLVDCNLQRLDGPVRGNGHVIADLASLFEGAGWRVIVVAWNAAMDALRDADGSGRILEVLRDTVDGDWQRVAASGDEALHAWLTGGDAELERAVAEHGPIVHGGHDWRALVQAFEAARDETERPVVILAHTVKGHRLGPSAEALNVAHKAKDLPEDALLAFRDRLGIAMTDREAREAAYARPDERSVVLRYLRERREVLGGPRPQRRLVASGVRALDPVIFDAYREGSEREVTTTAWLVRLLGRLARDETLGGRIVPIVPDEARTFGIEALFPQLGIYAPGGQRYEPVDADTLMAYRESASGILLEEGITEAGAMASFTAAGTQHANGGPVLVPFYFFYSMFGFQRVGDLIWAAGDARARGFLIGATSGRTTLNGEGLQHQDGHSHLFAHAYPSVRAYDVTYGYEVATLVEEGLRRMLVEQRDEIFYLTVANEAFPMPAMPEDARDGIVRGIYAVDREEDAHVTLLGTGMLLREALRAKEMLARAHDVRADVYAVTSFTELHRDAAGWARRERLHAVSEPDARESRRPFIRQVVGDRPRPFVAVSDWVRASFDMLGPLLPGPLATLGTDGYGRSDTRANLRRHFEVDAEHVVVAALSQLARQGEIDAALVRRAIDEYGIEPDKPDPRTM